MGLLEKKSEEYNNWNDINHATKLYYDLEGAITEHMSPLISRKIESSKPLKRTELTMRYDEVGKHGHVFSILRNTKAHGVTGTE